MVEDIAQTIDRFLEEHNDFFRNLFIFQSGDLESLIFPAGYQLIKEEHDQFYRYIREKEGRTYLIFCEDIFLNYLRNTDDKKKELTLLKLETKEEACQFLKRHEEVNALFQQSTDMQTKQYYGRKSFPRDIMANTVTGAMAGVIATSLVCFAVNPNHQSYYEWGVAGLVGGSLTLLCVYQRHQLPKKHLEAEKQYSAAIDKFRADYQSKAFFDREALIKALE